MRLRGRLPAASATPVIPQRPKHCIHPATIRPTISDLGAAKQPENAAASATNNCDTMSSGMAFRFPEGHNHSRVRWEATPVKSLGKHREIGRKRDSEPRPTMQLILRDDTLQDRRFAPMHSYVTACQLRWLCRVKLSELTPFIT